MNSNPLPPLPNERLASENIFRKHQYVYRLYWKNADQLTTNFSFLVDDDISLNTTTKNESMQKSVFHSIDTFTYLCENLSMSFADIIFLLDSKKSEFQLLKINWLAIDTPFSLNPYLLSPASSSFVDGNTLQPYYDFFQLNFSHHDSLREIVNFNLQFDWSSGAYLDPFNFLSYYSTYRARSTIPVGYFDDPGGSSGALMYKPWDVSKDIVRDYSPTLFENSELTLSKGLFLHNAGVCNFLSHSILWLIKFQTKYN